MIIRKQFPQFLAPYCIAWETSIGAVVFRCVEGKVQYLLIRYRNGHWEFPRGKIEDGESHIETMRRELREETGITQLMILDGFEASLRFTYTAQGNERTERTRDKNCILIHKKAIFYLAQTEYTSVVHLSHEHKDYAWLTYDDAVSKLTYDNAQKVLEKAQKHIILQKIC